MHNPMARDMTRKFQEVDVTKHQKRPFFHLSDLQRSKSNDGLPVTSLSSYCFSLPSLLFSHATSFLCLKDARSSFTHSLCTHLSGTLPQTAMWLTPSIQVFACLTALFKIATLPATISTQHLPPLLIFLHSTYHLVKYYLFYFSYLMLFSIGSLFCVLLIVNITNSA